MVLVEAFPGKGGIWQARNPFGIGCHRFKEFCEFLLADPPGPTRAVVIWLRCHIRATLVVGHSFAIGWRFGTSRLFTRARARCQVRAQGLSDELGTGTVLRFHGTL